MRRFVCLVGFMAVVSFLGCTPQNAKAPPLVKVAGKVKLDGKDMDGGEVRFNVDGQPPKICPVKNGAFEGEAFTGKNKIDIVLEKETGETSTTDKKEKLKGNSVDTKFHGPGTTLTADLTADKKDFSFDATSAPAAK